MGLTYDINEAYNKINNMRNAMTEKSSEQSASREKNVWWKFFMRYAHENHSRAVMLKARLLSITVLLR